MLDTDSLGKPRAADEEYVEHGAGLKASSQFELMGNNPCPAMTTCHRLTKQPLKNVEVLALPETGLLHDEVVYKDEYTK